VNDDEPFLALVITGWHTGENRGLMGYPSYQMMGCLTDAIV